MGGGAPPVEQSGFGQDKGATAQGEDATTPFVGKAQSLEHVLRDHVRQVGRGHDDRVHRSQRFQAMRHQDLEAGVGSHRLRSVSADEQAVPRVARRYPPVIAEHLADHAQLERGESVVDDNGDIVTGTL